MTLLPRSGLRNAPPRRARRSSCPVAVLAAVIALACGIEGRELEIAPEVAIPEPPVDAPLVSLSAATPPRPAPTATAAPPQASEGSEAASSPQPSLEDLLRLPASVGRVDPATGSLERKPAAPGSATRSDDPQRLRLELQTRTDAAAVRPSTSRSRTDAGVSVDVGETVRLRGGVRLEEESGREANDPVPTVGIEKRF